MSGFPNGKGLVKKSLAALGWELRRMRPAAKTGIPSFSNFNEDAIIQDLLASIPIRHRFAVDIGAGDGETMSNSYAHFRAGWEGIAVEWGAARFARLAYRYADLPAARLIRARITPDNILDLLAACETPKEFGFLNLDIDSYDHFVLERILTAYRPSLICAEINEKIPPPIRFTVKWHPDHAWAQDHFFGQSLSSLDDLGKRHGYVLAGLEYNNAFLIPGELRTAPSLPAETAYRQGYASRPDRLQKLPWNQDMEPLLTMPVPAAIEFIRKKFAAYAGRYILE